MLFYAVLNKIEGSFLNFPYDYRFYPFIVFANRIPCITSTRLCNFYIPFTAVQMTIIADTMNWFLNSMSDEKLFCIRSYWDQNFTVAVFLTRGVVVGGGDTGEK